MCGDRRNSKKTPYATIWLQTDSRRPPRTPAMSTERFPEMPAQRLLYAPFNLQGCESSSKNEEAVTSFRLSKSQCKVCRVNHVALFCMVNMPAFDTEEQEEHFFPLHFESYKLCWPAPLDMYANESFLPARLRDRHHTR